MQFLAVDSDKFRCSGSRRREPAKKRAERMDGVVWRSGERWTHQRRRQRHIYVSQELGTMVNYDECVRSGQNQRKIRQKKNAEKRTKWITSQAVHFLNYKSSVFICVNFILCLIRKSSHILWCDFYWICITQPRMFLFHRKFFRFAFVAASRNSCLVWNRTYFLSRVINRCECNTQQNASVICVRLNIWNCERLRTFSFSTFPMRFVLGHMSIIHTFFIGFGENCLPFNLRMSRSVCFSKIGMNGWCQLTWLFGLS